MRFKQRRKSHRLRSNSADNDVHNNWEISYGDMITLLLGFFILFFNIKTDRVNMKLLVEKLEKKFNKSKGESVQTGFQQKRESTKNLLSTPTLQKYKLHTNMVGDKLHIEFPGVSFFEPGKTQLNNEGKAVLKEFAQSIDKSIGSVRFVIRGYTDNSPTAHSKKYTDNLELSAWRSISAIRHLNKNGIDLKYMRIGGYGEADLSDRRVPAEERKLDRKVVIVVEPLDSHERNHETLNKVAANEEAIKKKAKLKFEENKKKLKVVPFNHPLLDFIAEPSLETWFKEEMMMYEKLEGLKKKPVAVQKIAPVKTKPSPLRIPASHVEKPIFKVAKPIVKLPSQKQVDQKMNHWIFNTYLYKKLNPYYINEQTDHRGAQ